MGARIFLDESGDLGWSFNAPYRHGGSSRYLTIAAVVAPNNQKHLPARAIRDLYTARSWTTTKERKWKDISSSARLEFAGRAVKLIEAHQDIKFYAMTVNKQSVMPHLRADPNLLYNYMMKLLLADEMARHDEVVLVPDPRSIKVKSGNSQHEYLQITLWYEKNAKTKLHSQPVDSKKELGIQFADMLAGVVQAHHEDKLSEPWKVLAPSVRWKTLFF